MGADRKGPSGVGPSHWVSGNANLGNDGSGVDTEKEKNMKRLTFSAAALVCLVSVLVAASGEPAVPVKRVDFPTKGKTITIIVPWSAGGSSDLSTRLMATMLEKEFQTPVQVVNKPGAGTQIGLAQLLTSKPDGYTLAMINFPTTNLTYLDPERKAGFSRKDFAPIGEMAANPGSLLVSADSKYKTFKDLIDAAKAEPKKLKVATSGLMTNTHIDILQVMKAAGVTFGLVHFDGSSGSMAALLGGHVDAMSSSVGNIVSQLKAGKIRVLGIMDKKETRFAPGTQTMEAQGVKAYGTATRGFAVPAGTPKEIIDLYAAAMKKIMDSREVKAKAEILALEGDWLGPEQVAAEWARLDNSLQEAMQLLKQQ